MLYSLVLAGFVGVAVGQTPTLYDNFLNTELRISEIPYYSVMNGTGMNGTQNGTEAVQFKCQYIDGLDFYDIQPLAIVADSMGGYFNYTDEASLYSGFFLQAPSQQSILRLAGPDHGSPTLP